MTVVVFGTVRLQPGTLLQAQAAMETMIQASLAEPGCLDYAYAIDVLDPTILRVMERWRDRAALDAHFQTPHLKQWRQTWAELGIRDRQLYVIEGDLAEL